MKGLRREIRTGALDSSTQETWASSPFWGVLLFPNGAPNLFSFTLTQTPIPATVFLGTEWRKNLLSEPTCEGYIWCKWVKIQNHTS